MMQLDIADGLSVAYAQLEAAKVNFDLASANLEVAIEKLEDARFVITGYADSTPPPIYGDSKSFSADMGDEECF